MNNILKNINFATRKIIFAFLFDGAAPFLFLRIKIEKEDTPAYTVQFTYIARPRSKEIMTNNRSSP